MEGRRNLPGSESNFGCQHFRQPATARHGISPVLVYLPHSSVTFSGAVNKSSNGQLCFVLVVLDITVNGTGSILPNDAACSQAGLGMPTRIGTLVL